MIELLLLKQSKTDSRMDKADTTMSQILQLLQASQISSLTNNEDRTETRDKRFSGKGA